MPKRWEHSTGVRKRAIELASVVDTDLPVLVSAALLHDVGYAPGVSVTGFHPLDGGRYLRQREVDETVVRLVAHHSCAAVEAEVRGLVDELSEFEPADPLLTDALIYCDMTTDPDGQPTDVESRLAEILERADEQAEIREFILRAGDELRAATARIEAMLNAAGVQPM